MFKLLKTTLLVSAVAAAGPSLAQAENRYVIGIDVSSSTPIVSDRTFAARAAKATLNALSNLERGDTISVQFLGDYGPGANALTWELEVSRRKPAKKVKAALSKLITSLPRLTERGTLKVSNSTNIVGFLELNSYTANCAFGGTNFLLLTDGIEWSGGVNGSELAQGRADLPQADTDQLRGCTLTMLGIGQIVGVASREVTNNLIKSWGAWSKAEGMRFVPKPGL